MNNYSNKSADLNNLPGDKSDNKEGIQILFDDNVQYYSITNINSRNYKSRTFYYVKFFPDYIEIINVNITIKTQIIINFSDGSITINGEPSNEKDTRVQTTSWIYRMLDDLKNNQAVLLFKGWGTSRQSMANIKKRRAFEQVIEDINARNIDIYKLPLDELEHVVGGVCPVGMILSSSKGPDSGCAPFQSVLLILKEAGLDDIESLSYVGDSSNQKVVNWLEGIVTAI
ncbi:MAG: hypothetical protein GY730_12065 [bacterium]|nr:hypothetical protein [bacterium]